MNLTERAKALFPNVTTEVESDQLNTLKITFRYHDVTFDDLQKLADEFGTKKINFGSETRQGGYCDTCAYSYSVNVVRVEEITK